MGLFDYFSNKNQHNNCDAATLYQKAKDLAGCLYAFPYQPPSDVPYSVKQDTALMSIIIETHKTTIGTDGKTQQTIIDAAERIHLQSEFKTRIFSLLERCLAADPEYAPAFLLYPKVAEYNTRAADRERLIAIGERFLPLVESAIKGTKAYNLIKSDIDGMSGNCFEKVERHLADFHYDLARLYLKSGDDHKAKAQYKKSCKLCSKVYGRGDDKIKLK